MHVWMKEELTKANLHKIIVTHDGFFNLTVHRNIHFIVPYYLLFLTQVPYYLSYVAM